MRLLLVRHGQTEWNRLDRAQGHSDVGLDDLGRAQAAALAASLATNEVHYVVSSDLSRARDTALPFAARLGLTLHETPALRERNFGELEGLPYTELRAWFQANRPADPRRVPELRPPGGESEQDMWERIGEARSGLEEHAGTVAVFAHGGTVAMLLARLISGTIETVHSFRLANASVTELFQRPDGRFQIARYNDTSHLRA